MCISGCYRCIEVCTTFWQRISYLLKEFGNFVDHPAIAVKKDSSGYVPSGFENLFRSDRADFVAKYFKYKHYIKNLMRNAKSHKS